MKSRLAELGGKGLTSPFLHPKIQAPNLGPFFVFLWCFGASNRSLFIERNMWGRDSKITPHPDVFFGLQRHDFSEALKHFCYVHAAGPFFLEVFRYTSHSLKHFPVKPSDW